MIGVATLVPPNTSHPPEGYVSYTDTPVLGSATAETSVSIRLEQPESVCQDGFEMYAEQPLPAPDQALSDQPRVVPDALFRVVPPTAVTYCDDVGNWVPAR